MTELPRIQGIHSGPEATEAGEWVWQRVRKAILRWRNKRALVLARGLGVDC